MHQEATPAGATGEMIGRILSIPANSSLALPDFLGRGVDMLFHLEFDTQCTIYLLTFEVASRPDLRTSFSQAIAS
ncbi:hypothetical protein KC333_g199 [Hortaea werneckii]|nr:hypothetical protein KC333_g199 [Hortaea werneckii]